MAMPMIEKIVQTAKQAVKATVDRASARFWSARETVALASMETSFTRARGIF
jgi:hypothetical protein